MIPVKLEELILNNQARFETRAFGLQQYSLLPCPESCKIVIIGYDFQPANIVNDVEDGGTGTAYQGLQRVSFFDGSRYDHFLHKMSGQNAFNNSLPDRTRQGNKPFHRVDGLYMIYDKDIGVEVSMAPEITVFPSAINLNIIPQIFPQNLSFGSDFNQYQDASANFGGSLNGTPQYSQAYAVPPVNPDFVDFNFEDGTGPHRYNSNGSNVYNKEEMANAWYLLVKYVVIFNRPESSR